MDKKMDKLSSKIGTKIKLERTKRGWSQEKLASLANLNVNSIGTIERGTSSPSIDTLAQIASAFGMEVVELIDVKKFDI